MFDDLLQTYDEHGDLEAGKKVTNADLEQWWCSF